MSQKHRLPSLRLRLHHLHSKYINFPDLFLFRVIQMSQQFGQQGRGERQLTILQNLRQTLFARSYTLITSLKLSFPQAVLLMVIEELQKISIVTRYSVNPTLLRSPEMYYIDLLSRVLLLDLFPIEDSRNLVVTVLLLAGQLLMLLVVLVPFRGEIVNEVLSKYVLTFLNMVLTYPSIFLSVYFTVQGVNVGPNVLLFLFSLLTSLMYESMQLECSFERENENLLVRTPRPITFKVASLLAVISLPVLTKYMFPMSFGIYGFWMLGVQAYNWTLYLHKFIYFHQALMQVKGVMLTVHISANLCFLSIFTLGNEIISQNILLFIVTFSFFLGNFFVTYRQYLLKNTIINKDLKGENEIGLYCVFYWHCYTRITEKKNELYVSSLLKKHTNECDDPACCCKNRQHLYDTYLKAFGNPAVQPHFDKIFIRHFIRKMLCDGYDKFSKSSILALLLSNYNIEVVEMITQAMQLIRKLSRLQQKKQLYFTEQFLLFCLKRKTRNKIVSINFKRGNLDLESVREFDEHLTQLNDSLRSSVRIYHSLWKQLQGARLNEAVLYDICKNNLELMFSIEQNYKHIKAINTESSELRAVMLFYSRLVLHDIHLLSEVRKDIKNGHERNGALSTLELSNIQLFGNNTASFVSLEDARIKWTSKNAARLFEYTRDEFHSLTVKNLMPRHFAERHDGYVQRWKATGHHIKLNKTTYLWGSSKSGSCFSMLMFVKVVPLPHEQEYAFFSCIEKLDDESELICSSYGEVYGSGKLFSKLISISPKYLQELKLNIQVFIPQAFDYFLEYFYPKNAKLKAVKRNFEVRREGYFPEGLGSVLKQLHDERRMFFKKFERGESFLKDYVGFIRQQMQELTCNVNGEYLSLAITPFKTAAFQRDEEIVVVLKVANPKKDSIEKYYSELEKTISKLQLISEEDHSKGSSKSVFKRNKSDFFKVFLNPKRMNRLLQQEEDEAKAVPSGRTETRKGETTMKSKPRESLFAHRKMLALGARNEIKNDRVRYNLFKMKKVLLEEGIISRYTYNMLIGKHNNYAFRTEHQLDREETTKTYKDVEAEERNVSEEDKNSVEHESDEQLAANKQNDNETFNSASSSATFISMTNHVKLFKLKLRSLNTPRLLMLLNIAMLTAVAAAIVGLIYSAVNNTDNLAIGIKEFKNNYEANLILDSLYLGQANIINLQEFPSNPYFVAMKSHYLESVSVMYKQQMFLRAQYKQINPKILSYLSLTIEDKEVLTVTEFIAAIMNQIISNSFSHVILYFSQSKEAIANHSLTNIFFNQISTDIFSMFLVYLLATVALFALTLPIVYKLKIKIKQIYDLLSKISTNDKAKYFKHFTFLNDEFRKKEEMDYAELNNLTAIYESKFKGLKSNTRAAFSEESFREPQSQQKQVLSDDASQQSSISTDKVIYFKITVIFLILLASVLFNYLYLNSNHRVFMSANDSFVLLINAKTNLTSRIIEAQYQMLGFPHETDYNSTTIEFVDMLYNTYSIGRISSSYTSYVFKFITENPCDSISKTLTSAQLAFCKRINNGTFVQGGIDNIYYTQRKLEEKVKDYYKERNYVPNQELEEIVFPSYFRTSEYSELVVGYYFSTLMIYDLYLQISSEMNRFADNYQSQFYISLLTCILLVSLFVASWIYIYLKLAESVSYINAFLLLIPFDVLSENPYIKLYIKNEFDYKTSY